MNVLHLSSWNVPCGVADFAKNLVTNVSALGVRNEVFPLNPSALRNATSTEFQFEMDRFAEMAADFDLIHIQHEFGLFESSEGGFSASIRHFGHALSGLKCLKRPVVVTFHSTPACALQVPGPTSAGANEIRPSLLTRLLRRLRQVQLQALWHKQVASHFACGPHAFKALALTPWIRVGLINSGFASESVSYVPHGIIRRDPPLLKISSEQAKATLGLPADSILLSIFGFVAAYKGYLPALKALKQLPPRYHLAIIGGKHPENQADMTFNTILENWEGEDPRRLLITGYASRETIDLYHAATDICLAPYLPEFMSASGGICWALTSGKPIIASNIPLFAKINREGDCLLLCTPNAAHELAWHIQKLSGDEALQRRLANNALKFSARHSWSRVAESLVDVYREMTGTAHPQATLHPIAFAAPGVQQIRIAA